MASFRKRNDKWEYRIRYKDYSGKNKEKTKGGFSTKTAAREAARLDEAKLAQGHDFSNDSMTIEQYLVFWLETEKEGKVSDNTFRNAKGVIAICIRNIGNIKLKDLKPMIYQQFINKIGKIYNHQTLMRYHGTWKEAFERAVDWEMLYRNPARKATIKGTTRKLAEKKYIEADEMEKLAAAAKQWVDDDYLQLFVLTRLLYYTGMRIGEATALNLDDIDYNKLLLKIDEMMLQADGRKWIVSKTLKTANSKRIISLDKETNELLNFWIKKRNNWLEKYDIDISSPALFINKLGNRIDPHMYRYNLRKLCKDNNIVPHYTPHMFRHTHTVTLVESGATMKFIAQRLGDTTQTISKVYDHVSERVERMNVEKLEALINESNTSSMWAIGGQN